MQKVGKLTQNEVTLIDLDLSEREIGLIDTRAPKEIGLSLLQNTNLTELNLNDNRMCDDGAIAIANSLGTNHDSRLATLWLYNNKISNAGASAFAECLKNNTALQFLSLKCNSITDDGAIALASGLKSSINCLQTILLNGNKIGDEGAIALAEALGTNRRCKKLNLGNNQFGDDGAAAFSECLQTNTGLQLLCLNSNQIGDEGAFAFVQGKESPVGPVRFPRALSLYNNRVTTKAADKIVEYGRTHRQLEICDLNKHTMKELSETMKQGIGGSGHGKVLKIYGLNEQFTDETEPLSPRGSPAHFHHVQVLSKAFTK